MPSSTMEELSTLLEHEDEQVSVTTMLTVMQCLELNITQFVGEICRLRKEGDSKVLENALKIALTPGQVKDVVDYLRNEDDSIKIRSRKKRKTNKTTPFPPEVLRIESQNLSVFGNITTYTLIVTKEFKDRYLNLVQEMLQELRSHELSSVDVKNLKNLKDLKNLKLVDTNVSARVTSATLVLSVATQTGETNAGSIVMSTFGNAFKISDDGYQIAFKIMGTKSSAQRSYCRGCFIDFMNAKLNLSHKIESTHIVNEKVLYDNFKGDYQNPVDLRQLYSKIYNVQGECKPIFSLGSTTGSLAPNHICLAWPFTSLSNISDSNKENIDVKQCTKEHEVPRITLKLFKSGKFTIINVPEEQRVTLSPILQQVVAYLQTP